MMLEMEKFHVGFWSQGFWTPLALLFLQEALGGSLCPPGPIMQTVVTDLGGSCTHIVGL